MRLADWLKQENLGFTGFGRRRAPAVHPATVRQWALGLRFPTDPADLKWIEETTGGAVTPGDFVDHRLEVRKAEEAAA